MRIGIDARILGSKMGGGDTYIRNLVRVLGSVDSENDYTLYLLPEQSSLPIAGAEAMRRVVVPPSMLQVRVPLTLPLAMTRDRMELGYFHFLAPLLSPIPSVVQIHDISYEFHPEWFTRDFVAQYRVMMPLVARHAAAILTISEYSRQSIIRRYRVPPERVTVAYPAADPMFRPLRDEAALAAVRARYGTGERFILSVGNLEPRKNLRTLIEAYVRLRRADAIRHRLVLVGRKAWLYDDIFAAARDSGLADEVVFTGYVPDEDLVALYNAAELFVYPSLFEGFGLPPLEAMACGTPVIASNATSLPEVVGDAGLLVDPLDVDALAASIARLLGDESLRGHYERQGLDQAALFSWEEAGRTVRWVFRTA